MVDPGEGLSAPSFVCEGASFGTNLNFTRSNLIAMLVYYYEMSRTRKSAVEIPYDHLEEIEDTFLNNIFGNT